MASISPKIDVSEPRRWRYHVYLSFSGKGKFGADLYNALRGSRIKTFMDDRDTSKKASYSTLKATMEDSWFAIVIFSEKYADTTRCLDELAMICEFMNNRRRILPVFYQIEPTDVVHQMASFKDAFTEHENSGLYKSERLNQWRDALRLVGSLPLSQWQYSKGFIPHIPRIVGSVLRKIQWLPEINSVNHHIISKPSSIARHWKYDVFFSSGTENWIKSLIFDTERQLHERGFTTYSSTSSTSPPAIEESRFAVILFSKTYAYQVCCLEELAKICECMKDQSRIVAAYIDVDPNDVRNQTGIFEEAFTEHQSPGQCVSSEKVHQWRDALRKVASLSSDQKTSSFTGDRREAHVFFVKALVESVCSKLQTVVGINSTGDSELFEATQAPVELEPSSSVSNENVDEVVELIRQTNMESEPTMPKSTKDSEAVEAKTPRATDGNSSQFFGGPVEPSPLWTYDVFLSFRGEETRKGFVSHLNYELQNKMEIRTFKDDEQLPRGTDISQSLLTAIEESRFAIIVLSPKYADSAWCLDELTKIVQCMEERRTILPIFYHVDPSDVRYQNNSYKAALKEHKQKERHDIDKIQQWRADLRKVGSISGWSSKDFKSERELIEDVVNFVLKKVLQASSTA